MSRGVLPTEREERTDDRGWRVRELQEWVDSKDERKRLAFAVSHRIRDVFDNQERELREERRRNDELASVRERIAELGFSVTEPVNSWQVKAKLDALDARIEPWMLRQLRASSEQLAKLADDLERLKRGPVLGGEEAVSA